MNYHFEDDNVLIEEIKKENQLAFTKLYDKYYESIHQVIYNIVKNKDVTDDLMSITFTKAYRKAETYVSHISLYMWLKTIATNTAIDFIRKNKKETNNKYVDDEEVHIQLQDCDYNDPHSMLEYEQTQNHVSDAMLKLKPRHRDILEKKLAGLSYKQIAQEVDVSEAIVKSCLNKARNKLKKLLTKTQEV